MNIIQILPQLELGGVERGAVDFAIYLNKQGHNAVIISAGGRLVEELDKHGITHYELPVDRKNLFTVLYCIREVKKIIINEKADIVHGRSRVPDWIGFWASLKTTAKFMITAHGCHSYHIVSKIIGYSKLLIVPSKMTARYFTERFRINNKKIRVVPRGLSLSEFEFVEPQMKAGNRTIAYVGRLSPIKGVEHLLDAFNEIVKEYPESRCLIVGGAHKKHKKYELFLKEKAMKLGIEDKVYFMGVCDVAKVLNDVSILVLPSLVAETFGRVLIEAQAKGVACVSTNLGAPQEIIEDGETGLLVPAFDASGITSAVKKYFSDKNFFNNVVLSARKKVEQLYTLERMCEHTVKVYEELLAEKEILVFKLASLGDVVLATSTFETLKKRFPKSKITAVVSRRFFKVVDSLDSIDEIVVCEDKGSRLKELFRLAGILSKRNFDISIDIQNNTFSQLLSFFSVSKKSIGVNRKMGFLNDIKIDYQTIKGFSPLDSQKEIISPLGITKMESPRLVANKIITEDYANKYKLSNKLLQPIVGINMGASEKWKTKTPDLSFYDELVDYCIKKFDARVVLLGTKEYSLNSKILADKYNNNVIDFCGKTDLNELLALISLSNLFVSPDSAPLHMCLALGVPCLALFGPTSPEKHIDIDKIMNVKVYQRDVECLGCYNKTCSHYKCMKISVAEVSPFLDSVLERQESISL